MYFAIYNLWRDLFIFLFHCVAWTTFRAKTNKVNICRYVVNGFHAKEKNWMMISKHLMGSQMRTTNVFLDSYML